MKYASYIDLYYAVNEIPSAAVLMTGATSVTSTTITITGSVPSGTVVTGFEVRWQRDTSVGCSDEDEDTISDTGAFPNSYQIQVCDLLHFHDSSSDSDHRDQGKKGNPLWLTNNIHFPLPAA